MQSWLNAALLRTTGTDAAKPYQVAIVYGGIGVLATMLLRR